MCFYRGWNGFGRYFGGGYFYGGQWMMMAIGILLIAAVVLVTVLAIRKIGRGKAAGESLNELKLRYAKGEITEEEFARMKKVLGK